MTTPTQGAAHLSDAELMRLLDGEESPLENTRNAEHLASCQRCAGEVERLRADARTIRCWLDRAEFEESLPDAVFTGVPAPVAATGQAGGAARSRRITWSPAWLRAAAVLLVIAAPVAAIPALRERVMDTIADLRGAEQVPATRTATAAAPAAIRFAPRPGVFVVQFDERQAVGMLRVGRADGGEAVLLTEAAGRGPVVSATSLHIRNQAGDAASYSLQVPAAVTRVTIRVGDRSTTLDAAALDAGVEVAVR